MKFTSYSRFRKKGEPRTSAGPRVRPKLKKGWRTRFPSLDMTFHAIYWNGKGSLVSSQLNKRK